MATRVDQKLGNRYRLVERVDTDGPAELYDAVDETLERRVSVKLVRGVQQTGAAEQMAAEVRSLAQLNHPSIIRIFDAGFEGQSFFLVKQRISGPTLADLIDSGPLTPHRVAGIGASVAAALAHAHAAGTAHRDVKPRHIVVDRERRAYLTGFGVAQAASTARLTDAMPDNAYAAPESVVDGQPAPAADVYALGLVLLECLTGRRARGAQAPRIPSDLSTPWRQLLATALAAQPEARPSADDLAVRLADLAGTERARGSRIVAVAPASDDTERDENGGAPRRRRAVLGAALLVAALVAGLILAGYLALPAPQVAVERPSTTSALSAAASPLDAALAGVQAELEGLDPVVRADLQARLNRVRAAGESSFALSALGDVRLGILTYQQDGRIPPDQAARLFVAVARVEAVLAPPPPPVIAAPPSAPPAARPAPVPPPVTTGTSADTTDTTESSAAEPSTAPEPAAPAPAASSAPEPLPAPAPASEPLGGGTASTGQRATASAPSRSPSGVTGPANNASGDPAPGNGGGRATAPSEFASAGPSAGPSAGGNGPPAQPAPGVVTVPRNRNGNGGGNGNSGGGNGNGGRNGAASASGGDDGGTDG